MELENTAKQRLEELQKEGHTFTTCTDTETILHGYEQWGEAVLDWGPFSGQSSAALVMGQHPVLLKACCWPGKLSAVWAAAQYCCGQFQVSPLS